MSIGSPKLRRFQIILAVFLITCAVFATRLIYLQLTARDKFAPASSDAASKETVAVRAVRGNICDRNGNVIVTNEFTYDMIFEYYTLPETRDEIHEVFLQTLEAVDQNEKTQLNAEENSTFIGTFPYLSYSEEIKDSSSKAYKNLISFMEKNLVTSKKTLDDVINEYSAEKLAVYIALKYDIIEEKKDETGALHYESKFSNEEITSLIKLRYDMALNDFGAYTPYVVAEDVGIELITYISELHLDGVSFEATSDRVYKYPGYASHILGQVGVIFEEDWAYYNALGYPINATVGISGCEKLFESYLRGTDGEMVIEKDKNGKVLRTYISKEPIAGNDVYLTIDINVQIAAEDALKQNINDIVNSAYSSLSGGDANSGAAVALDIKSGAVIAIASYPTYDLSTYNENYNSLLQNSDTPLLNRAINGLYTPGSTFKVGVSLAALEERYITKDTIIHTTGIYQYYPDYHPRCWIYVSDGLSHGRINVSDALRVSCNYFYYDIGRQMGIDNITKWASNLGLGQKTGIELGEKIGMLASPDAKESNGLGTWNPGDTLQAAIGQSINQFTPIQLGTYLATILNGGSRYQTHILKSVHTFSGEEIYTSPSTILSQVSISSSNINTLKSAMRDVIDENSSSKSNFRGYTYGAGAKTGTAQGSKNSSDNALFIAFTPYDEPELAVACVIEHGHSGGYVSYTARKIFDAYMEGRSSSVG